jgi:hypothetical protein
MERCEAQRWDGSQILYEALGFGECHILSKRARSFGFKVADNVKIGHSNIDFNRLIELK